MAQPYIGEIRMMANTYPPAGWYYCDGQVLPISENEALFQLIGTTYGGDGESTFALPNLQSRVPVHQNANMGFPLAAMAGAEEITLTTQQIPVHTHAFVASQVDGTQSNPANQVLAQTPVGTTMFFEDNPTVNMSPNAITPVGGSQPHTNMQPYLAINYIISLFGIFPSPT